MECEFDAGSSSSSSGALITTKIFPQMFNQMKKRKRVFLMIIIWLFC